MLVCLSWTPRINASEVIFGAILTYAVFFRLGKISKPRVFQQPASLAQRELVNLSENHYEKEAAAMVGVYKVTLRRGLLDTGLICRFLVRVYFMLRELLIMRLFGPKVSFP
jgi:hypothetical protein